MGDFKIDRRGFGQLARSRPVQDACFGVAREEATRVAARTARDTGFTASTTRAERADFGDRLGAYVVQEGAGVQTHFGNAHTPADHHASRRG